MKLSVEHELRIAVGMRRSSLSFHDHVLKLLRAARRLPDDRWFELSEEAQRCVNRTLENRRGRQEQG